jgi:hypothetical protein
MNEQDQQRKIRHRIAVLRHAAEVSETPDTDSQADNEGSIPSSHAAFTR